MRCWPARSRKTNRALSSTKKIDLSVRRSLSLSDQSSQLEPQMLQDVYSRPIKDLRISVTDRCNYRCTYCMPLEEYVWIDRSEILSFEEITRLARLFVSLGVEKIRITGGESLVRKDLHRAVRMLSSIEGLRDLCLTTNASVLSDQ